MNVLVFTNFMWALCCLIAALTARNYRKKIDDLQETIKDIETDVDHLENSNNGWKCAFEDMSKLVGFKDEIIDKLNEEVKGCRKEVDRLMNDLEYYAKRISKLEGDKQKIEAELSERETEITELSKEIIRLQNFDNKPVVNLDSLRAVLVPLAVKADEDAELINKLVELLRPKFKSDVLVNPEFYSQYGRVASGAPGKTTYLQWLSLILADQSNPEPDNGVEDDEF